MFTHPEILFDLARQHQDELISEARTARLARSLRRGTGARRRAGRHEAHDAEAGHPGSPRNWAALDEHGYAAAPAAPGAPHVPVTSTAPVPTAALGASWPGGESSQAAGQPAFVTGLPSYAAAQDRAVGQPEWSEGAGSLAVCGVAGAERAL